MLMRYDRDNFSACNLSELNSPLVRFKEFASGHCQLPRFSDHVSPIGPLLAEAAEVSCPCSHHASVRLNSLAALASARRVHGDVRSIE
jgi:hypothetical protein